MRDRECPLYPPGFISGFCADHDVDCEKCWEQYEKESEEDLKDDSNN